MKDSDDDSDHVWLSRVFADLERPLVAYVMQMLGDRDRASDVVQDAFARLCGQPRGQTEGCERPWLYKVCRNRAIDVLKKEGRMKTFDDASAGRQESGESDPAQTAASREQAQQASSLLHDLPDNQREVIRLKVGGDLSYREISELTGLSVSNVGYLLHTGLKTIRSRMA